MASLSSVDLEKLAAALSGAGSAAGSARAEEGKYLNSRDAVRAELYGVQQRASTDAATQALNTDKFTADLPGQGASEAARGALLQNVQDVGVDRSANPRANIINFTGGTRPSVLTPEARAAGAGLAAHGSQLIANPDSFAKGTTAAAVPDFQMSAEPTAGFWGQAAGVGGTLASILSALGKGGAGGGGDLTKALAWLKSHLGGGGGTDTPEGGPGADMPPGDPNDPYFDGESDPRQPVPSVTTSDTFWPPDDNGMPTNPDLSTLFPPGEWPSPPSADQSASSDNQVPWWENNA